METEEKKNPFRNSMGKLYTRGLFLEEGEDPSAFVYTLRDRDYKGYPSLYRLYMEAGDVTEHSFAVAHLDGWEHWKLLSNLDWFSPYITKWRDELEVALRSRALSNIFTIAGKESSPSFFQANKYILDAGWKPTPTSKRGRPSKDELKAEVIRQAETLRDIQEDALRIQALKVN